MKKLFLIFTLLTAVVIFSACALTDLLDGNKLDKTSFTGILTEQSGTDDLAGSHIITDGSDVTPLRSLTMNLSSSDYLNNKVTVTGKFNLTDNVFEVTGITVNEVLSEKTLDAGFKDYQNVDLGFKLKYHGDWTVQDGRNLANQELQTKVVFTAPEVKQENATTQTLPNTVTVEQIPFNYVPVELPPDGPADDPLGSYCRNIDADFFSSVKLGVSCTEILNSRKKIGVDMLDAIRIDKSSGDYEYYIYRSGFIYKLSFVAGFDPYKDAERGFEDMITSFRFIGMNEEDSGDETGSGATVDTESGTVVDSGDEVVAGTGELPAIDMALATFESTSFGFSAVYPKKWYYAGSKPDASTGYIYQYDFSEKSDGPNIITLYVGTVKDLSAVVGTVLNIPSLNAIYYEEGDGGSTFTVLINVADLPYTFEVTGPVEYKDLIINLAAGTKKLEPKAE